MTSQMTKSIAATVAPRGICGACILWSLAILAAPSSTLAVDRVVLRKDAKQTEVAGKLLVKAADGGLLLLAPDGVLWGIQPDEIVSQTKDDEPFKPLSAAQLGKQLLTELPRGFEIHNTTHYVICHNTSREYARWCGALLERLNHAFVNFWTRKGCKLHDSEFPLVAIVFADRDAFAKFAEDEVGKAGQNMIGYYSLKTNRVLMYDLTGSNADHPSGQRRGSSAQINDLLSRPEAEQTVATIIHEATHQIAFNCGLQARFADIPLWVSEGLAVYFETPDLQSAKGWRTIGGVHYTRLERFREYLTRRPAGSLKSLIADDKRIRDPETALDAYAEAWALNYYLIRQNPKEYSAYLKQLAEKQPLLWDDPAARLKEFQAAFGEDLNRLDADFLRQMQRVR
jgi:Protein of unknown function (DUF1570)